MLHIDFETRSRIDITKCGAYKYAMDDSTEVLMMAWALDDSPVKLTTDLEQIVTILEETLSTGDIICAHNAQFERLIMQHVLSLIHISEPTRPY